jgi:6-phosphogluconate dehydrogenase
LDLIRRGSNFKPSINPKVHGLVLLNVGQVILDSYNSYYISALRWGEPLADEEILFVNTGNATPFAETLSKLRLRVNMLIDSLIFL